MSWFKRLLERYLGAPAVEPGQGTAWRLDWSLPWEGMLPNWLAVLIAVICVAGVLFVYWRDARRSTPAVRAGMAALRLLALLLVLVFLSRTRLSIERTGLPTIVVLVDTSASMQVEDRYEGDEAEAAAELLKEADADRPTRLGLARSILLRDDGALPRRLLRNHKLRVYRFADGLVPVGRAEYVGEDSVDELLTAVRQLEPDGVATRPGPAVRGVLEELRGAPPAAIVVLSDGIATSGSDERLSAVARLARDAVVPLFCVGLGRDEPIRDLQLYDVLVEEVAFVNDPLTFSAKFKASGVDADEVDLVLRDGESGRELKRTPIPVPRSGAAVPVELSYTPTAEGRFDYVLRVEPQPGETNRDNNSETRSVVVHQESIRVLLVDSSPRYEFRFVKHLLEREPTIELKTVLQEADTEYVVDDRTALDHFPVRREELAKYHVIVFGDVDPGYLGPAAFENLEAFVEEDGGGVMFVAGPHFNPLAYRGTPLEEMYPVDLDEVTLPDAEGAGEIGFRPRLTAAGRNGIGIFRFDEDEAVTEAIWRSLPELRWMVSAPETRPGAIVVAERTSRGGVGRSLPVVAVQQFGNGKVLFQATDELWLWRQFSGDAIYGRYWVQSIRHLCRSRLLGGDDQLELVTDRRTYQQGDGVQIRARFHDESLAPAGDESVIVMVERAGEGRRPLELTRLPRFPNVYEGRLPRASAGSYRVSLIRPALPDAPRPCEFRVEAPDREMERTALDRADLVLSAERTHGRYLEFDETERLADDLPRGDPVRLESREPIPLWNRWELLLLFAAVLLGEWLLRKREQLV